MIVRNESDVIQRCLRAVKPYIDAFAIVDTGSEDNTEVDITDAMAEDTPVPGELVSEPWKGMSGSRNDALALARKQGCDYILMLDADDVWTPDEGFAWPEGLTKDAYHVLLRRGAGCHFVRPMLMRSDIPWRYVGEFHEQIVGGRGVPRTQCIPDVHVLSLPDGHRSVTEGTAKYDRIAKIGEGVLEKNPNDTRAMFYLAQSYRDAERPGKAMYWYGERAEAGGFPEEIWYSLYQIALIKWQLGFPSDEVLAAFHRAYETRPSRPETLVDAAAYCRRVGRPFMAFMYASTAIAVIPTDDLLFVDPSATRRALDELAIAAHRTGRLDVAIETNVALLERDDLPEPFRARVEANLTEVATAGHSLLQVVSS